MVQDGEYTAVLDRFEETERETVAVLLLERGGETVDELVVPAAEVLRGLGVGPDAVLSVAVTDDGLAHATFDLEATEDRGARAQERFDALARRPPRRSSDDREPDERQRTEDEGHDAEDAGWTAERDEE